MMHAASPAGLAAPAGLAQSHTILKPSQIAEQSTADITGTAACRVAFPSVRTYLAAGLPVPPDALAAAG
jgi:hypothetical protein